MPRIQICVPDQQIDYFGHGINSRQKVEYSPTVQGMNRFSNSRQLKYPRNVSIEFQGCEWTWMCETNN